MSLHFNYYYCYIKNNDEKSLEIRPDVYFAILGYAVLALGLPSYITIYFL